jgi:hypothetical protein
MTELSILELSGQDADLLPTRETMDAWSDINAFNLAVAFPNNGFGSAEAHADQTIVLLQNGR